MGPGLFWNFPSKTSCTVSQTLLQTMYVVLLATVARRLVSFFFWHSVHLFISFCPSFISHKFHRTDDRDVCPCHLEVITYTDLCRMQATSHCTAWGHILRLSVRDCLSCCFLLANQGKSLYKKQSVITWVNSHSYMPVVFLAVEQCALVDLLTIRLVPGLTVKYPGLNLDADEDAICFPHTYQKIRSKIRCSWRVVYDPLVLPGSPGL